MNIDGKVILLGSMGVGKTSLILRYQTQTFPNCTSPTIGASYFSCKINVRSTKVKMQVWDTAGQERFRAVTPLFFRQANAALLVYDITQYYTFRCLTSWVEELRSRVEEPMILIVVGNKCDKLHERRVNREEAERFAESIGAMHFETSALENTGVDDLFLSIASELIELSQDPRAESLRVYNDVALEQSNGVSHDEQDEAAHTHICC